MFTRFNDIVTSLESLGKTYTNGEKVRKILRSLLGLGILKLQL